jgi:DNA-binding NarL/FixJ family response regulator
VPDQLRVLICDDHPVVRAGIEAMLRGAGDVEIVASVGDPDRAVVICAEEQPDVVLMDLRFGEGPGSESAESGGVRATRAIRKRKPAPQVLILTNYSTDSDVLGAISAGAVGYLLKDCAPDELAEGIRQAARGQTVMNKNIMGKLRGRLANPFESLTNREQEVLVLASQGKSNRAIAKDLVLTEATVKSHMAHVFSKLNVKNRTAAVAVARERGIID